MRRSLRARKIQQSADAAESARCAVNSLSLIPLLTPGDVLEMAIFEATQATGKRARGL